jgi:hypothetical protein
MYKWAGSRSTRKAAEKVKEHFDSYQIVHAEVVVRKLGSPKTIVPTVYDVWVRPLEYGREVGYTLKSKRLENLIRDVLNRG